MGVDSEGSEGTGVVGEVGRIVWVRRRNGSWWPGRILGQHELSASHLMSPRSGTPVKLLGREDASVDWYNLEKSKRVKAFRCGEFDACIERAEASQGVPIKKREKYARREDAILHALELERQMFEGRRQGSGSSFSDIHPGPLIKEQYMGFRTENDVSISDNSAHCKLLNYRNMNLAFTETTKGKSFSEKWKGDMHDDRSETALQKRGLQAFGVQEVFSKRKLTSSGSYESSKSLFFMDNPLHPHPAPMHDIDHSFLEKSSDIEFSEEAINKRQNNCRPVLQVVQSSAKLPKTMHPYGYASDHLRTWQSYSKYRDLLEKENTSFGVIEPYESDVLERLHSASDTEDDETFIPSTSQSFLSELVGYERSDEYDHWGCTPQGSLQILNKDLTVLPGRRMDGLAETGISRWNLKRKRNIRKASNRAVKPTNVNIDNMVSYEDKKCIFNISRGGTGYMGSDGRTDDSVNSDLIDKDIDSDFSPTGEGTYPLAFQENSIDSAYNSMDDSDRDSCEMFRSCWETEKQFHAPQRRQWDRLPRQFGYFYASKYRDRLDSGLVDVDLKVQASYQGKRVPLVSLMSKLNGKAIIGHSLEVEALSDGFTDTLLLDLDYGEHPSSSEGNGMAPVRRTGRRSALLHIPRPHDPSDLEDCEVGVHKFSDLESKVPIKSQLAINTGGWSRPTKKGSNSPRPAKKLQKKSSKQSSTWDVKPRSLSSLAKWQSGIAHDEIVKLSSKASTLHTLIMPGDVVPLVTCVPAKVVFSRILESVGRSPFHAAACRDPVTTTG